MSENDRFLNRKAGKTPEKSNFAQACTLLGQFLKEKRNLGVVIPGNGEIGKEKPETSSFRPHVETKNFLTNMGNQAGPSSTVQTGTVTASTMVKSSDFFQQLKGFGAPTATPPPNPNLDDSNKSDLRKSTSSVIRSETAQMTIFYGGQVLVFNDLPADKANEVMVLARKGSSNVSGSAAAAAATTTVPVVKERIDLTKPAVPEEEIDLTKPAVPESNPTPIPKPDNNNDHNHNNNNINVNVNVNVNYCKTNDNNNNKHESLQQRPADQAANGSDLPIARRNSLHRFLEKRKDRVAAKAPYQVVNHQLPVVVAPPKPDEGNQWSQQEAGECSDQHLELKL